MKEMKGKKAQKKSLVFLVLLIVMTAFGLAGCGGDADNMAKTGSQISFQTTDLAGNEVDSADLFAGHKVTMINIWGTFCGPCIEEMPELEVISREYADKGAAVVGIVCDVPVGDDSLVPDAESIIGDTGVTYTNVRTWQGMDDMLPATMVPSTYFVDENGQLLEETVIGADVDRYRSLLDQFLAE